jgi:hypothetical protein
VSDSIIVEVTAVEASTIVVEVVAPPPAVTVVEIVTPPPIVAVIEVEDFGGPPIGYPQLPVELRQLPIVFTFSAMPAEGAAVNVPMGFALTVPVSLAGAVTYAVAGPAAPTPFHLNRISGGVLTALGTVTLLPSAAGTAHAATGPGGPLAAGDVLQIVPGPQDTILTDVGITIMANRV